MKFRLISLTFTALAISTPMAWAHGNEGHMAKPAVPMPIQMEQKAWGIGGQANAAVRSVTVRMTDDMRFTPDQLEVKQGETIRFVLVNAGKVMHEYVLGTKATLDEHAELMKRFPNMEHDEPYMAHVAPGKQGEIVWTFNRAGRFDFACLLPGHYDAGMVGTIQVTSASQ